MRADFSGYATKAGLKCSDGRTIMPDAFKEMDGKTVPLVWQHGHNDSNNVLGHAVLEAREDGVYAHGSFNDTPQGKNAKSLVEHGDIVSMSIYANKLVEKSKQVFHGVIREVSLVLSGANPGALIEHVNIQHSDGDIEELEDEAIITTGLELMHVDGEKQDQKDEQDVLDHEDKTIRDVYNSLSEEQRNVVHFMIGAALEEYQKGAKHSDNDNEGDLEDKEGNDTMSHNVFEKGDKGADAPVLSHEDVQGIVADAVRGGSLKEAVEQYAVKHGIENLEVLFPDAKSVQNTPEWEKRETAWVAGVLNGTKHTPFSRIKTRSSNITHDEARAKGYIKGNLKKEEWFSVTQRTTAPTTVYKKQKLDRDDIIDITDFDVVAWMKGEMRLMLNEELAGAALVGDGRDVADEDKIKDPVGATDGVGIRSIANDHEAYVTTVNVALDGSANAYSDLVDEALLARRFYKGTGTPTFYTTEEHLTKMLLLRDQMGRRLYRTVSDLASELRVSSIVPVEVMERETDLLGIMVNLDDYSFGADRGGEVNMFDDFDIDYNQNKYLIETRVSGALTKLKSALVFRNVGSSNTLVDPAAPTFVSSTNTLTIPSKTGVDYQIDGVTQTAGDQVITEDTVVDAVPQSGYYFETNAEDQWLFEYTA